MDEIVHGINAVKAALERGTLSQLWLSSSRHDKRLEALAGQAKGRGVQLERIKGEELDRRTNGAVHQGAAGARRVTRTGNEHTLEQVLDERAAPPFLLVLDGVKDPHNLGACLRASAGAGIDAVIAPKDRAASLTASARKVASGAAEFVPFIQVTNLARTMHWLKERGIWTVGLAGEATQSIYEIGLTGPLAVVLGAEGGGLRRLTKRHCDFLARIPMAGGLESLNVSVAAGIALFEAVRQRM
jgi:23S rRNA (guanosine2251-2'-O)-methyltransferase